MTGRRARSDTRTILGPSADHSWVIHLGRARKATGAARVTVGLGVVLGPALGAAFGSSTRRNWRSSLHCWATLGCYSVDTGTITWTIAGDGWAMLGEKPLGLVLEVTVGLGVLLGPALGAALGALGERERNSLHGWATH
jgi:hypothetical protein